MCSGYVPSKANYKSAANVIAGSVSRLQTKHPDAPVITVGDFNTCTLNGVLPSFQQHVTCPTRHNKTIDLCYSSVDDAYISQCLPPMGLEHHNILHLLSKYRQKLKRVPPVKTHVKVWFTDAVEQQKGCYACIDWDVFFEGTHDIYEGADILTDYVKFCQDSSQKRLSLCILTQNTASHRV